MSLVIKKSQEGGNLEVRRYKRGNDEVDLDAFVRLAEVGFDDWLDSADIKKKRKKEVRAAYQDMITRINNDPESFTARLGGGFTNTAGITNKTKGFDAYGIAAGYLGKALREMSAYQKPEVKSDKQKYNRNSGLITSSMQEQIWGNSPESFVKLDDDSYDETTGKRGLTNRTALTITGLTAMKNNLRDYYDFDSDDDYNHAIARIDNAIATLLNSNPNDDWFSLNLLGLTGMDKYFSTGVERRTTPLTSEEQQVLGSQANLRDFENWMSSNKPFYTGALNQIPIGSTIGTANTQQKTELVNKLRSLSNDDLKRWLRVYINHPDEDYTNYPSLVRIYGGNHLSYGLFTSGQIMREVLARAISSGLGKKITNTLYYFPDTLEKHADGSSTVYTYNVETQSLDLVDTQDVEDYRKQYLNEYRNSNPRTNTYSGNSQYSQRYPEMYPSQKKGGVIRALQGVKFDDILSALTYLPEDLTDDRRLRNIYADGAFTQQPRTTLATDLVSPGNNQYDPEPGGPELEQQDYYQNWLNILTTNEPVAEAWARRYRALQPTTSVHYSPWFNQDGTFNFKQFKNALVNNKKVYNDAVNGIGHDFYRGRVYQMLDQNGSPLAGYYNELQDGYELVGDPTLDPGNLAWIYQMRKKTTEDPRDEAPGQKVVQPEVISSEEGPEEDLEGEEARRAYLAEVMAKTKGLGSSPSLARLGLWEELGTDLLGAGRLAGSIWANNRIAKTVRESLRPKLHNTYELYSPVTGAFSEMQLRNRQGAETLSQAYRPFTSDASLAAARMLEGQRHANDLQYQGFLADDKEIKRTQAEALARQEGNIARRSALENENRDAIIANNQALAQLEASRIKQNWNSINNYLQGVEGRVRENLDYNKALLRRRALEDEYDRRNFEQILDLRYNASKYLQELDKITSLVTAWEQAHPTSRVEIQPWYKQIQDRRTELMDRLRDDNLYSMAQRRGWDYTSTYRVPGKYYDPAKFDWKTIIRKNGGPIKISTSQLIDKIIRNNQ